MTWLSDYAVVPTSLPTLGLGGATEHIMATVSAEMVLNASRLQETET